MGSSRVSFSRRARCCEHPFAPTPISVATAGCGGSSSPGATELRTIAIPYASLKGVYQIRQWDSRSAGERDEHAELDQLARVLAERERTISPGVAPSPTRGPLLSRMRRPPDSV